MTHVTLAPDAAILSADILYTEILDNLARYPQTAARVFHGRGKAFSGWENLHVEWYPPHLIIQNFDETLTPEARQVFAELFATQTRIQSILHQHRQWPDTSTEILHQRETALSLPLSYYCPVADDLQVQISLGKNRNTGLFTDMRAGWHWVRAHSAQAKVLNLFSYTGVFSLFALAGGAAQVDNVDMAANVHKVAQRNHEINGFNQGKATFIKRDVLKSERWFENRAPYDLIILDPPPYQKKAFHGWPHYQKILQSCRQWLAPQGQLLLSLNHPMTLAHEFLADLQTTFPEALQFELIETAVEIRERDAGRGLKLVAVSF